MIFVGVLSPKPFRRSEHINGINITAFCLQQYQDTKNEMIDSAFSSPGRYVAEIVERLRERNDSEFILVFNPRYEFSEKEILKIASKCLKSLSDNDFVIFSKNSSTIIAYLIKHPMEKQRIFCLSALSTISAQLDAKIISALFNYSGKITNVSLFGSKPKRGNGFLEIHEDNPSELYRSQKSYDYIVKNKGILKHVFVCPHHAGDILFLCQALRNNVNDFLVAVNERYADIAYEILPKHQVIKVHISVPGRDGFEFFGEQKYVSAFTKEMFLQKTSQDNNDLGILHFLRPYRDYNASFSHLREMFSFAAGQKSVNYDSPKKYHRNEQSSSVIIHFDGGWSLKRYPRFWRSELIDLISSIDLRPIILGKPEEGESPCEHIEYSGVENFKKALDEAAAFIGIDSFPSHFSIHYGMPTIQLFGCTHPRNSRGKFSTTTSVLQNILPCVPCQEMESCKIDKAADCRAMPSPSQILQELKRIINI